MGKIRVTTLGIDELEKKQKKEARLAREARQAKKRQEAKKLAKEPEVKGEEKAVSVEPIKEEPVKETPLRPAQRGFEGQAKEEKDKKTKGKKASAKVVSKRVRSKGYKIALMQVDRNKTYLIAAALDILPKIGLAKFDETVELHINTTESGISGNLNLPHGTGKKTRVSVADDKLIAEVEKGKIDFDVLITTPAMMSKLAKVARVLGPRGLMPNPKTGTITNNPEDVVKKFTSGQIHFKTETKTPIIHLTVGKVSFGKNKLMENIKSAITTVQTIRIRKAVLKSTMSPGIKIDFARLALT